MTSSAQTGSCARFVLSLSECFVNRQFKPIKKRNKYTYDVFKILSFCKLVLEIVFFRSAGLI